MALETRDARLKDAILKELRADPRVNEAEIGVAVDAGIVTLTGSVDSDGEKVAAQEATHRAAGVLDVANDIHVRAPFALGRSDTDLARAIRKALRRDLGAAADRIHTTVYEALVTLDGTVDTLRKREAAESAARREAGVRHVVNEIVVRATL